MWELSGGVGVEGWEGLWGDEVGAVIIYGRAVV